MSLCALELPSVVAAYARHDRHLVYEMPRRRGIAMWDLMVEGKPEYNRNGTLKVVNGSVVRGEWYLSDLDVSRSSSRLPPIPPSYATADTPFDEARPPASDALSRLPSALRS